MLEPRPLPMGRKEFDEWAERIISGALVPCDPATDPELFKETQKCTLAGMIMHLGPTESHKPDAYFIHSLRKAAVNEVAHAIGTELKQKARERFLAKQAEEAKGQESEKD